jgi:hypothetical protein
MQSQLWSDLSSTDQLLDFSVSIQLPWNPQLLSVTVTGNSPLLTERIYTHVNERLPVLIKESFSAEAVRIIDMVDSPEIVVRDVRPFRAFVLGFVLSVVATLIFILLRLLLEDRIYLPSTISTRFGIPTIFSDQVFVNDYTVKCVIGRKVKKSFNTQSLRDIIKTMQGYIPNHEKQRFFYMDDAQKIVHPVQRNQNASDNVEDILLIKSGTKMTKAFVDALQNKNNTQNPITRCVIINTDRRLYRRYYRL